MLLNAAFIPPDRVQEEIEALRVQVNSALGGLDEMTAWPFVLPITGFRSLTAPDANRVAEALGAALADIPKVPVIRFSTLTVASDGAVRLGMAGDVDELVQLAHLVPSAVERLRLYVDRRRFWPGLILGRTMAPDSALSDLRAWRGAEWPVEDVFVLRKVGDGSTVHSDVKVGSSALL